MNWWDKMNFVNDSFLNFCWNGEEIQLKSWPRHLPALSKNVKTCTGAASTSTNTWETRETRAHEMWVLGAGWIIDCICAPHILSIISAYCRGLLQCFMQKIWGWGKADLVITGIFCFGWNIFFLQHDKKLLIKPPTKPALSWTWGNVSG